MTVGTSMKKISSLALLVRQLRWVSCYDQRTNNRPYEIGLRARKKISSCRAPQNAGPLGCSIRSLVVSPSLVVV